MSAQRVYGNSRPTSVPRQRSLDDLGMPLEQVTFCVIDFETTGSSSASDTITEVGAVRVRGGEQLATLQTLVNPGCAIAPTITVLTGISEAMVTRAPRIESVLGTLVDFIGDSVIVGHNIRFDMSFLQAALQRDGREPLTNVTVDTLGLARRLLRDEVANCKLGTLAAYCGLPHRPTHRALDDALATGDLLHVLIDRCRGLGVLGLDDLLELPTMAGHAHAAKLRLTDRLPRSPGVYLFRDSRGTVLYVGKATNLRSRVRSYFSTDDRKKVGSLIALTARIDHKKTASELEASVLEVRLIHHLEPRFNTAANRWRSSVYIKLIEGRKPRWSIVRAASGDGAVHLGPIGSKSTAKLIVEALQQVLPLESDTANVLIARRCVTGDPQLVIDALTDRMHDLAAAERFEEAAATRDRLGALCDALRRQRLLDRLRRTELLEFSDASGDRYQVRRGQLIRHWPVASTATPTIDGLDVGRDIEACPADPGPPQDGPLHRELTDELMLMGRWLERNASTITTVRVDGEMASPVLPVPVPGRSDAVPGRWSG